MRRRRGFTLVELLAATALFAVLTVLLFQLVSQATDVWRGAERNRELNDESQAVLELLAEDLRHVWPGARGAAEQEARLVCTWRSEERDDEVLRVPALRFTRLLHESRRMGWMRRAGDEPGGQFVATLQPAEDPASLQSTGGLAESFYTMTMRPGRAQPSLLRAMRARAGGADSLLDPALVDRPERIAAESVVLAEDVLHFGVDFDGAFTVWDSTRALLAPDDPDFPWGVGADSLVRGRDDVWPATVRLVLVLDDGEVVGNLTAPLADQGERLPVSDLERLARADFVLVGREWMAVEGEVEGMLKVRRGARGTLPASHALGAPVRLGRAFQRTVRLPATRENLER